VSPSLKLPDLPEKCGLLLELGFLSSHLGADFFCHRWLPAGHFKRHVVLWVGWVVGIYNSSALSQQRLFAGKRSAATTLATLEIPQWE